MLSCFCLCSVAVDRTRKKILCWIVKDRIRKQIKVGLKEGKTRLVFLP